jgi:peptidoglycan/LPS O-acetylase OafA/YrhL
VLSGFLITHLLLKELQASGGVSLRDFYLRRSLRIFPAYYAFLILSLTVDHFQGDPRSRDDALAAALYLQNYRNAIVGHSNSSIAHSWSLGVEEQFYLLWPAALALLARRGPRAIVSTLCIAVVAVVAWRWFAFTELGFSKSWLYNAFDSRFDSLAIGCLLAVILRYDGGRRAAAKLAGHVVYPAVTIGLLALPILIGVSQWRYTFGFTYEALLVAVLIVQLMQLSGRGPWQWIEWRAVTFTGTLSYSLYLYHNWGLGFGDNFSSLPRLMQFVIGAATAFALAYGSYRFIEQPFLRLKDRIGHRHLAHGPR